MGKTHRMGNQRLSSRLMLLARLQIVDRFWCSSSLEKIHLPFRNLQVDLLCVFVLQAVSFSALVNLSFP